MLPAETLSYVDIGIAQLAIADNCDAKPFVQVGEGGGGSYDNEMMMMTMMHVAAGALWVVRLAGCTGERVLRRAGPVTTMLICATAACNGCV